LVEGAIWLSLIVIVPKKNNNLIIYVDFTKQNATIKKDLWPLLFIDEVISTMARHELYIFLKYHQNFIVLEDQHKTTIVID
jgi:4-hydroxyphenylpyruvate dioxygenase-like putative hemolysin